MFRKLTSISVVAVLFAGFPALVELKSDEPANGDLKQQTIADRADELTRKKKLLTAHTKLRALEQMSRRFDKDDVPLFDGRHLDALRGHQSKILELAANEINVAVQTLEDELVDNGRDATAKLGQAIKILESIQAEHRGTSAAETATRALKSIQEPTSRRDNIPMD